MPADLKDPKERKKEERRVSMVLLSRNIVASITELEYLTKVTPEGAQSDHFKACKEYVEKAANELRRAGLHPIV